MITGRESYFIGTCLEGFFYGLYSGIFVMYLQCRSNNARKRSIIFYALLLLYVLSAVALVSDLVSLILESRFVTLSLHDRIDSSQMLFHLSIVQYLASGCCDFLAQCILIYRCWIVWGQNIWIAIIPSFLAIAYLATWLGSNGAIQVASGQFVLAVWGGTMALTSFALSMAVNTLSTGLIVFKILKVFLEVKSALVEQTLGTTGGTKLRNVIIVIIESGMALLAIQLVRFVLYLEADSKAVGPNPHILVIGMQEMANGIASTMILVRVSMGLSFSDKESFVETVGGLHYLHMPPQDSERIQVEDIYFINPSSDPNTLRQTGCTSSSGVRCQERSEDAI